MIYTLEEKARMDRLIAAFADSIAASEEFELLYSDKVGFLSMYVHNGSAEGIKEIKNFDDLLIFLFRQISGEVKALKLADGHYNVNLLPVEVEETRRRAVAILNTLEEDREYCLKRLEEYLALAGMEFIVHKRGGV